VAKSGFHHGPIRLSHGVSEQKVPILLVDETDLATVETGVSSPTIQLSKNGGSWASASDGTWAEIGNGWYTVQLNSTDTNLMGWLIIRVVKASTSGESFVLCDIGINPEEDRTNYIRNRQTLRKV
tara:strand:+ start:526 stop:900 length:375 start_codon:yes stop_codon:yes gene_type:complete